MTVVVAIVFACPGIACFPLPLRRQCCGTTAPTPGSFGTWRSSSMRTGTQAARALPVIWSNVGSLPLPAPGMSGCAWAPSARQRSGRRHRPRGTQQRSPLDWRTNARSWSDEARTQAYAAPGAQARPCPARIEPPHAGKARRRQVSRLRDGPAQGLDGEGQHGHRPQVRRDHGRGFADQKHDQIRQGHAREPGPERAAEGRPEPGHPTLRVGPAGPPSGAESSRPSGKGQPRVHEPTMLDMRAGGLEVAREPSRLPVHRLRICLQR
jgi:hypothetical protein